MPAAGDVDRARECRHQSMVVAPHVESVGADTIAAAELAGAGSQRFSDAGGRGESDMRGDRRQSAVGVRCQSKGGIGQQLYGRVVATKGLFKCSTSRSVLQ